eukprot:CAMPEP_0196652894 /NCGR_PEP_ID=MMETSP1086-20130531/2353_1 /TAXON_ID=77921 /ORGANISM="Cyanoptyche  gloeocystis , Strain SAG4.97" /LENGTH=137 /DNA_ID=CAMNT_0041983721 /DNA_START=50 /DNA_END=463 /DNA_ORIENTATION=-
MSSELVWSIIRNNSSYLVKRDGLQFSREPGNLMNINSFKYSGLANKKAIGVSAGEGGVVLSLKAKGSRARKPAKANTKILLKKDFRRNAKVIIANTDGNHYRADLKAAALARLSAVSKSLKPKAGVKKGKSKKSSKK